VPERLPFERLQWASVAESMEKSELRGGTAGDTVVSTEATSDGFHVVVQVTHWQTCGTTKFRVRRVLDVTSGDTLGAYRVSDPCLDGGLFAPASAVLGGVAGKDAAGVSYWSVGSWNMQERGWAWWPTPLRLEDIFADDYYDLADGTLLALRPSAVRVAAPGSIDFSELDTNARVGSAGDDMFVWSQLLEPAGSRVRAWTRAGGVVDVVDELPADPCAVTATETHVVGLAGAGNCTSFLHDIKFWRTERAEIGNDAAVEFGPVITSSSRIGMLRFVAHGDFAAFMAVPEVDGGSGPFFLLVARFSDRTLWRIDPQPGWQPFRSSSTHALTDTHLYLLDRKGGNLQAAYRIPLSDLETIATPFVPAP